MTEKKPTFRDIHGEAVADTSTEPFIYEGVELTDERAEQIAEETIAAVRARFERSKDAPEPD